MIAIARLLLTVALLGLALAIPATAQVAGNDITNGGVAPLSRAPIPIGPKPPAATTGTVGPLSTELTATECGTLGGVVVTSSVCKTGLLCRRIDESRNAHHVCLKSVL